MSWTPSTLAARIDHTLLKPEATAAQIDRLCDECRAHGFFAACVNPCWVRRCVERLSGSRVCVATVAGFPLGATTSTIKAREAAEAVQAGAREVDMVLNLGALLDGDDAGVTADIAAVVAAVRATAPAALVKVILETAALPTERIVAACACCVAAGADFVKTSTGFHPAGGAREEHVQLLRQHAAPLQVKASGGIRDLPTALHLLAAGAERLGTSSSVALVQALAAAS